MPIERLSSLAVLHCYKQREIDIEKVIHSFVVKKERCLVFLLTTRDDIGDQNWLRRTEELWVHVLTNNKLFLPP